jgi:hypothetical protein
LTRLCLDAAPMCRLARPYAQSLRSPEAIMPIVKVDWACAGDITVVIDTMLGMHAVPPPGATASTQTAIRVACSRFHPGTCSPL